MNLVQPSKMNYQVYQVYQVWTLSISSSELHTERFLAHHKAEIEMLSKLKVEGLVMKSYLKIVPTSNLTCQALTLFGRITSSSGNSISLFKAQKLLQNFCKCTAWASLDPSGLGQKNEAYHKMQNFWH